MIVRVAHTEARVVDNRDMPDICLQHMVAVMLLDGTASFQAAHDKDRMADPTVLRLRSKVRLIPSDELERLEPTRAAIVEIALNDGTVLSDKVLAVRGTADNPMPRAEVVTKCRDLMAPVLGADQTSRLIEAVLALETVGTMRDVAGLLRLS